MRRSRLHRAGWSIFAIAIVVVAIYTLAKVLDKEQALSVQVASPTVDLIHTSLRTNGRVVPMNDFQARAAFAGTVGKVFVHVGEKVSAGQLLIKMLDPFASSRYASATSALRGAQVGDENIRHNGSQEDQINFHGDIQRAETEKTDAQKQLLLLQNLAKTGAASEGEVENAQHRLSIAIDSLRTLLDRTTSRYSKSEVVASNARLNEAKASLETAREVLANSNVVSEIAGTVYSLPVAQSDFVPMGAELMRVTDLSMIQVHAYIDEPNIGQLSKGEPVAVTWEAKPGKIWQGHIEQVPLTVSHMDTRIVGECIVTIDHADGTLLPDANVVVDISTSKPTRVLTIPRSALRMEGMSSFAFRVVDGRLVQTKVQTGIVTTSLVQILSGLSERDVVAVTSTPVQDFTDGLKVKVIP